MQNEPEQNEDWMGPFDDFAHALSQRIDCEYSRGQRLTSQLRKLPSSLQAALRVWWDTNLVPEQPVIMGFSAHRLLDEGVCKSVPVSILWLKALIDEPERTIEHIRAGSDVVIINLDKT